MSGTRTTAQAMLAALLLSFGLCFQAQADSAKGLSAPQAAPPGSGAAARACLVAASEAEARLGLPEGILAALAVVESTAHPFAIGTALHSHYPSTLAEALRLARANRGKANGGCFQINIAVHARGNPEWVFDPWAAALFAGRLLIRHAEAVGQDWGEAIARYAGAGAGTARARLQRCRVAAAIAGLGEVAPEGLTTEACRGGEARTAKAKAETVAARARGPSGLASLP